MRDLDDEQAARRTTASELCLGGLIKHVMGVEERWSRFAVGGAEAMERGSIDWEGQFRMTDGETLAGLLAAYERVARETDELVSTLPDLDLVHPLPEAPWFEPGVELVGAPGAAAHHRGDRAARRARGHHPGVAGRGEDDGLRASALRAAPERGLRGRRALRRLRGVGHPG